MADCHNLFLEYNGGLNINKSKKDRLSKSKDALRKRIRNYFAEHHPEYKPMFYIQGSYKMGNMIKTKDDECDLDDGVYFLRKPDVTATTLQGWVYNAVEGHTEAGQQHRKKCIRVLYANDYHIDLPVYYQLAGDDQHPFLAVKNIGWEESDPKEFIDWFRDVKTDLMVRISRYLKGWGDHKRNSMPSGLAMAVLTEKNLVTNEKDDIALRDTLKEIRKSLKRKWECVMPTTPKDDLFSDYDETFKTNFFNALDAFITDADAAIGDNCQEKASKKWRKHLGDRFPLGQSDQSEEARSIGQAETDGSLIIILPGQPIVKVFVGLCNIGVFGCPNL